jgi:hypothetical protein
MNYPAMIRFKIKAYIKSSPFLYRFITSIKKLAGEDKDFLCRNNSDLCVEAYPSSANSFLCKVLRYSYEDLKIGQHTHTIANIKIAMKYNIPVVTIIRNPLDAVSSRAVRFNTAIEQCILEYIEFYEFIAEHSDELIVVSFENVVNNTSEVLRTIEKKTNIILRQVDTEEARKYAFSVITSAAKENKRFHRISLPSEEREYEKENVKKKIRETKNYQRAEALYKHMTKLAN